MSDLPRISDAEYEVMKVVWKYAPINTVEVIDKLSMTSKWNPKTIQTMLLRLVKKRVLSCEKDGRVFVYTPIVKEKEYLAQESSTFLNRFYKGAINSMILNFLEQDKLTPHDIEELKRILEERQEKAGK